MSFFRFLRSKLFLINVILIIGAFIGFIFLTMWWLKSYTNHGEAIEVPNLEGMQMDEVEMFLKSKDLQYVVTDSVYENNWPKGTVVDQNPVAESFVKRNRKIYLTVNALNQRKVEVPVGKLIDVSIMQAEATLKNNGLRIGKIKEEHSDCDGCVIRVEYKSVEMLRGSMVPEDSKIDIVVGRSGKGALVEVRNLIGMDYNKARELVMEDAVNLLVIVMDSCTTGLDSSNAIIYKQQPIANSGYTVRQGGSINIWMSCDTSNVNAKDE